MNISQNTQNRTFSEFISKYSGVLKKRFRDPENQKSFSLQRGIPPEVMHDIMDCKPLNVFIPDKYGGYGGNVKECLKMLELSSYESLPLSLMMGINGALFIQPVCRYGNEQVISQIMNRFTQEQIMGGLMITEPEYGSDALHMQTCYEKNLNGYRISGIKHWAGLTGWADYWLLTARKKNKEGSLSRDIGFFIHDTRNSGINVEEYFDNLGLYMLPYGRNKIDVTVPESYKLETPSTGIKLMLDMLHRSRLQFPGMAMGFLSRIIDESLDHVKNRNVGGRSLFQYDQVKERIARMQACFTSCSAMCLFTSENTSIKDDLSTADLSANSIKSVITDMMQDASQSFLQLAGAKGYTMDHLAGRSVIDSRPFQIFEGSNDILYQQIAESVLKKMKKTGVSTLHEFLKDYELTDKASDYLRKMIDFSVNQKLSQRKQVVLGKMLGYTVSLNMVITLGEKGFREDLIRNTIDILTTDIRKLITAVHHTADNIPTENIDTNANWYGLI